MSSLKKQQTALLEWFDRHRRVMPWRALKGRRPDPYHVWLSEIMLQQTTVVTVGSYFMKFIERWPTVHDLALARIDDVLAAWAGLGYYARARNLHKCAAEVAQRGSFPPSEAELMDLPGIGPYTAAAIASIAFDLPAVAVDGNVERVVSRFCGIEEPLPLSKPAIREEAARLAKGNPRPGDFTQAFMELGATVCTPRNPKCGLCPWSRDCVALRNNNASELPRKLPKKGKPVRHGKVFFITDAKGRFLVEKRQGKGLYEGMYQLPTTEWVEDVKYMQNLPAPEVKGATFDKMGAEVRHSFTHFDLVLEIWKGRAPAHKLSGRVWIDAHDMEDFALPTLMKKAIKLASAGG